MQLYYSPNWSEDEVFFLSEEESRHSISVMRHKLGDELTIIDGRGHIIKTKIIDNHPKKVQLKFISKEISSQAPNKLHIAISPTKSNDRFEWFIEKACEIGVGQITPILCERTERNKINIERWKKIVVAACKQAQVLHFPIVSDAMKLNAFIQQADRDTFVASIESKEKLSSGYIPSTIIIGPEGDFSSDEFAQMRSLGLKEVSLSDNILRVETAGIVAVSQWNSL